MEKFLSVLLTYYFMGCTVLKQRFPFKTIQVCRLLKLTVQYKQS